MALTINSDYFDARSVDLRVVTLNSYVLLGCKAVWLGENPTFRRNIDSIFRTEDQYEVGGKFISSARFLLDLLLSPEYGGDIFLRNVRLFPIYRLLQSTRPYFSLT
jgi:hypothetical protein